uniref:Uncharacterized protein n=1 Tax=Oryza meridionalis TaxID=40149 RepID=A0A0E0F4F8_9ORYZ
MAPCKPTKARSTGKDPGSLGEGWSYFLGKPLVREAALSELVLSSVLAEGQEVKLSQHSPSAFPKLDVFAWMCRTCGFDPTAELFAIRFTACATTKDAGDDVGMSKKRKRAIAKGGQVRSCHATKDTVQSDDEEEEDDREAESEDDGTHGDTPSPSPAKSGAGSRVSPVHPQDIAVAKTLLAISSIAAKPVSVARGKKKKGKVIQIGRAISDSEGFDRTPTSPVLQRGPRGGGGRTSPPPASNTEAATGGSASAPAVGANISQDERVELVHLQARRREGKAPAVEATVIAPSEGLGLFTEMNEFGESCAAVESLFVRGLAAHLSAKKSALERLDGYRLWLRKAEDDLRHKKDERRVVADTLRRANAENRSLRANLEVVNKRGTERDRQHAAAEERIKSLETRLVSAETAASTLRPATNSAKQACYTLRLAMNDLGVRAKDAPGDDGTAFNFSEWTQEAARSVVEVAGAYGDCCACVSASFMLSLLHAHGCEHIRDFPQYVTEEWPSNSQHSGAALKAFQKGFWQDGGRDCAKTRLRENLERIAKEEEAAAALTGGDPRSSEPAAEREGEGNGGQDHPEAYSRKSCIRPPTGDWRKENEKFVEAKGLSKVKRPLRPIYREMLINGNSYQVIKVAKWMRMDLGQTLEDYDRHRVSCLENSTNLCAKL